MKRIVFVAIFGIFVTTGLSADPPPPAQALEPPEAPRPPSPDVAPEPVVVSPAWPGFQIWITMARLNKKGQVVLKFQKTRSVRLTATRVLRDGKEVKEKHTFDELVTDWVDQVYDPKDIKLLGSDRKRLDKKMLPELLKKERLVLIMYGDEKIDSTYLKVIKEGTPILVLPWGLEPVVQPQ